jgi:hypothetical protein
VKLHLHIEKLVLDGFPHGSPGSGARVADGIERELRRLLSAQVPAGWRRPESRERVRGAAVTLSPAAPPERFGEQIAASVYRTALPKGTP